MSDTLDLRVWMGLMLNSIKNNGSYEHQSKIGLRVQSDWTEKCDRHGEVKTLFVAVTVHSRSDLLCVLSSTMGAHRISISDDDSLGSAHVLNTCAGANWTDSWMCSAVSTLRGLTIHLRVPDGNGLIVTAIVSGALNLTVTHVEREVSSGRVGSLS